MKRLKCGHTVTYDECDWAREGECAPEDMTSVATYTCCGVHYRLSPRDVMPSDAQLYEWIMDEVVDALDGCEVEPDGHCEHGHSAWTRWLGYC